MFNIQQNYWGKGSNICLSHLQLLLKKPRIVDAEMLMQSWLRAIPPTLNCKQYWVKTKTLGCLVTPHTFTDDGKLHNKPFTNSK